MRSPLRVVAAFVTGPLRRGAAQIVTSVTVGVCVALVSQMVIPERGAPATEVQRQAAEAVVPRDDRLPKSAQAAPPTAVDESESASALDAARVAGETHIAKLPAVEPRDDRRTPVQFDGPQPDTAPVADNDAASPSAIAESGHSDDPPPAIAGVDEALQPPAEIPGQPIVLPGAGAPERFASDDFDSGTPRSEGQRRLRLLALPFNAVEGRVFRLGDVVASIGRPKRRY